MAIASFPSKYIYPDNGSLVLKVHTDAGSLPGLDEIVFLRLGLFRLSYLNGQLKLTHSEKSITLTHSLPLGESLIVWTWQNGQHRLILSHALGTAVVTSPINWVLMTSDVVYLTGEMPYKGSYALIEFSLTELINRASDDLIALGVRYHNTSVSSQPRHAYDDWLPLESLTFQRDFKEQNIKYAVKPFLEATQAPSDQSPILARDEEGPLTRQYFFDLETGEYTSSNTEWFTLGNRDWFDLAYDDLDRDFRPLVYIQGELFTNYLLEGHRITLLLEDWQRRVWFGETIKIEYKLDRAYTVEWNERAAYDSYIVKMSDDDLRPVTITQEGNRFSSVKLATEIELNPIVNSQHTGFLYIDTEPQAAQAFRLSVSSNFLVLDGKDTADFTVELIDQHGNEILSPYVDVFIADQYNARRSDFGELVPIITEDTLHARNAAGRAYFRYRTRPVKNLTQFEEHLLLVAYDRRSGLGAQVSLRLKRPLTTQPITEMRYAQEGTVEAALPFEYFARYYGRSLPEGHPLHILDADADGMLTRSDWLAFQSNIHDQALMTTTRDALIKFEQFTLTEGGTTTT